MKVDKIDNRSEEILEILKIQIFQILNWNNASTFQYFEFVKNFFSAAVLNENAFPSNVRGLREFEQNFLWQKHKKVKEWGEFYVHSTIGSMVCQPNSSRRSIQKLEGMGTKS